MQGKTVGAGPAARSAPTIELAGAEGGSVTVSVNPEALRSAIRPDGGLTIDAFPLSEELSVDLEVQRFRVTGPDTKFVVGSVGGSQRALQFDAERVTLLRGKVAGEPASSVFLAFSDWGSAGSIELPGGRRFTMTGGRAQGAAALSVSISPNPAVTQPAGVLPDVPFCGVGSRPVAAPAPQTQMGVAPDEVTQEIELAVETDYELFSLFDDLDQTAAYMVELWGAVSNIYLRDVNARIKLTFVRLWDDPNDLFNAEDPLFDFLDYWENNEQAVPRDVAQFVSGRRNMPYGGVAFVEALCGGGAYAVTGYLIGFFTDPDVPGVFGYDVQVTAHELGHNCGTFHTHDYGLDTCDELLGVAQRGTIMSYCSQTRSGANGNTDLRFHAVIQGEMHNHIFTAPCIAEDCNGNGVDDAIDIAMGDSDDLNGNGIADECEDCNDNGTLDPQDIALGDSDDDNGNGIPDECEPDCDGNGLPDDLDIQLGNDTDLNSNNIPDGCETDCNTNGISDYNEIQADMTLDLDRNAALDSCQDCDGDMTNDLDALGGAHNVWVASAEPGTGLSEFLALSGVRVKTSAAGALDDPQDLIITDTGRILVSSAGDDRVVEFDETGALVGDFVSAGSGGLNFPTGMTIAPGGNLLVAGWLTNGVLEYDGASGAFVGTFVAAVPAPWGIAYGPNGNLFVTTIDGRVVEYNGSSGALVGEFVTLADNGGLTHPRGILFKPDGNLLVASFGTNQIMEYDGATGAFIGQFNHGGTDSVLTLDGPWTLRLGPDGDVYANRNDVEVGAGQGGGLFHDDIQELHINSTRIYIFDIDSGDFVRSYVTGHDTGLSFPTGFDFMPGDADCNFNQLPDSCDIASGFSSDVNGNGIPDSCEGVIGDTNGDGIVDVVDLLALLGTWGPCPGCAADFNGDGQVNVIDLLILLSNFTV